MRRSTAIFWCSGFLLGVGTASITIALLAKPSTREEAADLTAEGCTSMAAGLEEQLHVCELGLEAADRAIRDIDMAASGCEAELGVCKQLCGLHERKAEP